MPPSRILLAGAALLLAAAAHAQGEELLTPLRARPVPEALRAMAKAGGPREHFVYQNATQALPIIDDFSIDRTRKRWARAGDPGVTLDATLYRLEVAGNSTPGMAYSTDTTYAYLTDLDPDPPATQRTPLPSLTVLVRDLGEYPPTEEVVEAWPAYNVFDTVQHPSPDTAHLASPPLVQDSLLVYSVPPDPRTYINPDNSVRPLILWEDDDVHVNGSCPVDPPTIGVATFDGLDRRGYPYDFGNYSSYGIADRLTSVPIDLSALTPGDSVYLSFFYQPKGLSGDDFAQPQDSLVLEFWAPELQYWSRVWRTPYTALQPFQQVLVPVKLQQFLKNGFRFRFLNYGTLSGAFDQWHLDYVRLDRQRTFDDTRLIDVAYVYPETSLLETYTSVTFRKFREAPMAYMANRITALQRNLDNEDRFIEYGFLAREEGSGTQFARASGLNTSGNASSAFASVHDVNPAGEPAIYDPALSTDAAFWRVKLWTNTTPDINRYNDTVTFVQELSNYMAYDDGSAEMGYSINVAGGAVALRFDISGQDTLRAVRMCFDPQANDPESSPSPLEGSFLLTVWKSLNPEVVLHQNYSFSSPSYRLDGVDHFVEIPLDSLVPVEGTIYVGWVQTNGVRLNVGFDRNRNNQDKLFRRLQMNFAPSSASFQGSLMLRPVFTAPADPFAALPDEGPRLRLRLFPNPASEAVFMQCPEAPAGARLRVADGLGRIVAEAPFRDGWPMDASGLAPGAYTVRLDDARGMPIAHQRLLIQR